MESELTDRDVVLIKQSTNNVQNKNKVHCLMSVLYTSNSVLSRQVVKQEQTASPISHVMSQPWRVISNSTKS